MSNNLVKKFISKYKNNFNKYRNANIKKGLGYDDSKRLKVFKQKVKKKSKLFVCYFLVQFFNFEKSDTSRMSFRIVISLLLRKGTVHNYSKVICIYLVRVPRPKKVFNST